MGVHAEEAFATAVAALAAVVAIKRNVFAAVSAHHGSRRTEGGRTAVLWTAAGRYARTLVTHFTEVANGAALAAVAEVEFKVGALEVPAIGQFRRTGDGPSVGFRRALAFTLDAVFAHRARVGAGATVLHVI